MLLPIYAISQNSDQLRDVQTANGINRATMLDAYSSITFDQPEVDFGLKIELPTVKVHPNPSSLDLYVTLNGSGRKGQVIVYDILGNIIVKSESFKLIDGTNTWSYNVSSWHAGTYVVRVLQDDSVVKSLRFIKN